MVVLPAVNSLKEADREFNRAYKHSQRIKRIKKYRSYIVSKKWKQKRVAFFQVHGRKCYICGNKKRLEIHHRTCKNLRKEKAADVIPLCHTCHEDVSFDKGKKLSTKETEAKLVRLKEQTDYARWLFFEED